jgi:O-6-methylguanine DNA methyltransferase
MDPATRERGEGSELVSDDRVHHRIIPSRYGDVIVVWREDEAGPKILGLTLPRTGVDGHEDPDCCYPQTTIGRLCEQIARFLDGEALELPVEYLDRTRCSDFQWRVLMAEKEIPRGYVCSYGQLAAVVGKPKAARAVGTALARNPFPIIIPCHRTVRRDGSLGGFGGGLPLKRALLEMEGVAFDHRGRVRAEHFWVGGQS